MSSLLMRTCLLLLLAAGPVLAAGDHYVAIIPQDGAPTYFRDQRTGEAAGFAVDVMNEVAKRAGFSVTYAFGKDWEQIEAAVADGTADIIPSMGISTKRETDLDFSQPVEVFPISFFVRTGTDWNALQLQGSISTGVIRGSVAFERLKDRKGHQLVLYDSFTAGLFDLLAGKIDSFACPQPTLLKLAQDSRVEDHVSVVGRPIDEIRRAIAVRDGNRALLARIDPAVSSFIGTPQYRELYVKWYGTPTPYWTAQRVAVTAAAALVVIGGLMLAWRYFSVQRLNIELRANIEERNWAMDRVKKYADDLERTNRELEQLIRVSSHDLQEPLRKVVSFAELMQKRYAGRLDGDADRYLGYLVDGANRMNRQIKDILSYAQVGIGESSLRELDLNSVLADCVQELGPILDEAGAQVTHDPLPIVIADRPLISNVFRNLLMNAVTFRGSDAPRIHVAAERAENAWKLSVRDNGIGIAPEYREKIFAMFQRLQARDASSGSGMGLAICKKSVELHGGSIWTEAAPGGGAVFCFTLPDRDARP